MGSIGISLLLGHPIRLNQLVNVDLPLLVQMRNLRHKEPFLSVPWLLTKHLLPWPKCYATSFWILGNVLLYKRLGCQGKGVNTLVPFLPSLPNFGEQCTFKFKHPWIFSQKRADTQTKSSQKVREERRIFMIF